MNIPKIAATRTQLKEFKICNKTDNKIHNQLMPPEIKVHSIGEEKDVPVMVKELLDSELIGVDSEWRP